MTDAITLHRRKPLTPLQRAKLFDEHGGICCICGCKIQAGEKWIDEHRRALGLLGTNEMTNRGPAHVKCASVKTATEDIPMIAKAKRTRAKHLGCWRSSRPLRSRNSFQRYEPADPDT